MNFALGAAIFGAMILMPLYYQSVRHLDPVLTGLLVAPTGIGAAIAMRLAARLTDRIGSGWTAVIGGSLGVLGTSNTVLFNGQFWLLAALVLPAVLFGSATGVALYRRTNDFNFRWATLALLVLSGVGLLAKAMI